MLLKLLYFSIDLRWDNMDDLMDLTSHLQEPARAGSEQNAQKLRSKRGPSSILLTGWQDLKCLLKK